MEEIYLDYNATFPLDRELRGELSRLLATEPAFGNPSSTHGPGQRARQLLEDAREELLHLSGLARTHRLVFTSGGTEANHLALRLPPRSGDSAPVLTTALEHPSLEAATLALAQREDRCHVALPHDPTGRVDTGSAREVLTAPARILALHAAHNETGVVQPLRELRELLAPATPLHVDATQWWSKAGMDLSSFRAQSLTVSAHKLGGLPGIGALFVERSHHLEPLWAGGGQESELRAGTENLYAACVFAAAARLRAAHHEEEKQRITALREHLRRELLRALPSLRFQGSAEHGLPNTLSVTFPHGDGRDLLLAAQLAGLAVSSGAACSSGAERPSRSLLALGLDEADARRTLRLALGPPTTIEEVDTCVSRLARIASRLAASTR